MKDLPRRTLCIALLLLAAWPSSAQHLRLTILHTNDVHGHVLPFANAEAGRGGVERPSVGGAARRATLIRRIRAQTTNPVVVVDAGDVFTRGALTTTHEGIADVEAMNATGYDLAAIGNNEFKARDGVDQADAAGSQLALLRVVRRSRFPWLCANARDEKGGLLPGVAPFVVRTYGGVRVGFLGVTAPRSAQYPQTRGWTVTDPIAAARAWVPVARKECDVLVAVTHIGAPLDLILAATVDRIDAIVGGDSHTYLYKPSVAQAPDGRKVPIVQAGEFGANLGRLDLLFEKTGAGWRLSRWAGKLIPVTEALPEDPHVAAALSPFVRPFRQVVGVLPAAGQAPAERTRITTEAAVEAMRRAAKADLGVLPPGGGMFAAFGARAVTRYDVYAAMPFHNNVAVRAMTGEQVSALLAAQPGLVMMPRAAPLEPARSYTVASMDYVAATELGWPAGETRDTGIDTRDALLRYLTSLPRSGRGVAQPEGGTR